MMNLSVYEHILEEWLKAKEALMSVIDPFSHNLVDLSDAVPKLLAAGQEWQKWANVYELFDKAPEGTVSLYMHKRLTKEMRAFDKDGKLLGSTHIYGDPGWKIEWITNLLTLTEELFKTEEWIKLGDRDLTASQQESVDEFLRE